MDFVSIMKQTAIRIAYTSCKFVPRGWLVRGVKPRRAAVQPRSRGHGCGMLSPGPERGAALPKPLRDPVCRPQPSAQSPKEEAAKGAEDGRRGPKYTHPTTHFARKQSSVGSVSAQETSCGKVREQCREAY